MGGDGLSSPEKRGAGGCYAATGPHEKQNLFAEMEAATQLPPHTLTIYPISPFVNDADRA